MSDGRENNRYNPLSHSSIDAINERKGEREAQELAIKAASEELKVCMNRLFDTSDGKHFLNCMIGYCGINLFDKEINPAKLIEDKGKRQVWLEFIRPHLDKSILAELDK